jgi:ABC-2 type transport system ATP-binding protein
MDEPFSGLDPVNAVLLMDTLLELRNEGKAVLFSTHRMDQVEKMCDSIALIHRSKLVLSGTMADVKAQYPKNRVQISFEGGDGFLRHPAIETVRRYPGKAEIRLRASASVAEDAQDLLKAAVECGRVTRFEVTEPTLEEIFIEKVQETMPSKASEAASAVPEAAGSYAGAY